MEIKKNFEVKEIKIDKRNINKFIEPEWHRRHRSSQISKIRAGLEHGIHWGETITVNNVNNINRLINGNHRISAFKDYIIRNPEGSIITTLHIYKNLTSKEEKEIYSIIAQSIKETTDDYLKARKDSISLFKLMDERGFPFNLVLYSVTDKTINSMRFTDFLKGYIYRTSTSLSRGGKEAFLSDCQRLMEIDYYKLKDAAKIFIESFGEPGKLNVYSKSTFLAGFMKVYYTEVELKEGIGKELLLTKIKKYLPRYKTIFEEQCRQGGVVSQEQAYRYFVDKILNSSKKEKKVKNLFEPN